MFLSILYRIHAKGILDFLAFVMSQTVQQEHDKLTTRRIQGGLSFGH